MVHCKAKKLLKRSAFCLKSVLCSKGGMSGIFFPLKNDLGIDQYVSVLVLGLYNFDARSSFYQ